MKSIGRNAFVALFILGIALSVPNAVGMNHMGGRGGMHMHMGDGTEFLFAAPTDPSERRPRPKSENPPGRLRWIRGGGNSSV